MPDTAPKAKTSAELKQEHASLARQVLDARNAGRKLEAKLLDEMKAKIKKHAGDLEGLLKRKRDALVAYESARAAERAAAAAKVPPKPATPDTVQDQLAADPTPATPASPSAATTDNAAAQSPVPAAGPFPVPQK